jgi:hypothetical protein
VLLQVFSCVIMRSRKIRPKKKNTGDFIFTIPARNLTHARQSALKTLELEEKDPFEELIKQWKNYILKSYEISFSSLVDPI